ncbi:MAG: hypothetical protein I8H80_02540 [Alphaproteobacteria bacterium]|nr:hypothetical protein [Alphaproteobacteria bacterium]
MAHPGFKEFFDSLISMFPKLWNSVYINGLPDFQNLMQDYKQNTLLPFLNDALEMSEEWRSMIEQPNPVLSENSQFNALIPEEEKLRKLKENIEFLKRNKTLARPLSLSIHLLGSTRSYHETLSSKLSIHSCFEEINKMPNHFLIATAKLKGTSKHLYRRLETWNDQCLKYKIDQKPDSKARHRSQFEFDPYKVFYDQYSLFATTAAHALDDANQIINTLIKMTAEHRRFWRKVTRGLFIVTFGMFLYFYIFTYLKILIFNLTNFINA